MRVEYPRLPGGRLARGASLGMLAAVAYFLSGTLAYALGIDGLVVLWIPSGVMLAVLVSLEPQDWFAALVGAFVGNVLADLAQGFPLPLAILAPAGNSVEVLSAAWVVRRFAGPSFTLASLRQVLVLILGAATVSNGVTTIIGAIVLHAWWTTPLANAWFTWWIGDGLGMLIVAPAILAFSRTWRVAQGDGLSRGRLVEGAALLLSLVLVAQYVFASSPSPSAERGFAPALPPSPYLVFPFLLWGALRFGPTGAAFSTILTAAIVVWNTALGLGPLVQPASSPLQQAVGIYMFLAVAVLSTLVPAAVISERKQAMDELAESEQRYRLLFDQHPTPLWVFDVATRRFLAVNEAAVRHYGFSRDEFLAMTIDEIRPAEDVPKLHEHLATLPRGLHGDSLWRHRKRDGTLIDVEIASHDLTFGGRAARLVLATDVTERRLLQRQFLQAQKMDAVGRLAGGIAHDFNNVLTVILANVDLTTSRLHEEDPLHHDLAEIRQAAEQAAALTRQLLTFARRQVLEPRVIDVNALALRLDSMLRRLIGESISVVTRRAPDLWAVRADPGQLEQVVMNLVVNARDAMPGGGKLTIETANVTLDEAYVHSHLGASAGDFVMIAVSDTGHGFAEDVRQHLFEPFFTTKREGKGTGLGLATCYGIVKQCGGTIWAYSEVGVGSTFKVYLPRVTATPEPLVAPADASVPLGGHETILLVEDDAMVRDVATRTLNAGGYRVLQAANGVDALRLMAADSSPIDLLVTDLVMPQMGGQELIRRLRESLPSLRVLFTSGYTDTAAMHHGVLDEGMTLLQKPFVPNALLRKVREVLDAGSDTG